MERIILHSDLNNFYASVACRLHPELREKPVIVGGDPEKRHGIVLAKNMQAKRCGVHTAEPLWQALRKCPGAVVVPPEFERYRDFSERARAIYCDYTDRVESFGIDECWLDVTAGPQGDGKKLADEIRWRIRKELGVTVSVGVSFNKVFAKLGSDLKKPDATTVISPAGFRSQIWDLPAGELLYVGGSTARKLQKYDIRTIGELARSDVRFLKSILGVNGVKLWEFANGLDRSPVRYAGEREPVRSIGNSTTTPRDLTRDSELRVTLCALSESVARRLRRHGMVCRSVKVQVRDSALHMYERQGRLEMPTCSSEQIFRRAYELLYSSRPPERVRSMGVTACALEEAGCVQLSFLPSVAAAQRQEKLEYTLDAIRSRYGDQIVRRARMLTEPELGGVQLHGDPPAGAGFQSL